MADRCDRKPHSIPGLRTSPEREFEEGGDQGFTPQKLRQRAALAIAAWSPRQQAPESVRLHHGSV